MNEDEIDKKLKEFGNYNIPKNTRRIPFFVIVKILCQEIVEPDFLTM